MSLTAFSIALVPPVADAHVILSVGQEGYTNADGYVLFAVDRDTWLSFSIHHPDYLPYLSGAVFVTENFPLQIAITEKPKLTRLIADVPRLVTEDGLPFIWAGATNFLLFQRYLEDFNIEPMFYPGANLHRFTLVMKILPNAAGLPDMRPENYPGVFWDKFEAFWDVLEAHNCYGEATVFCDLEQLNLNHDLVWQRKVFGQAVEIMQSKHNAILELVNEYPKNGVDPTKFDKPRGVLSSRGSGLADAPPARPCWDFFGWHGRRDFPKVASSTEDMWYVGNSIRDGWHSDRFPKSVAVHDEPMGFGPIEILDRRSTNPFLAMSIASASRVLGAGATFHSDSGALSVPWHATEARCANAFYAALR